MKKTYENPMLHVVSINKNDIIATSNELSVGGTLSEGSFEAGAPGQRSFDNFDGGY